VAEHLDLAFAKSSRSFVRPASASVSEPGVREGVVVLDDDPTGAQALAGVEVLLNWTAEAIADALSRVPAVHLLTNTRALEPNAARVTVRDAAQCAVTGAPDARVVLRGDSTLRAHLREEYEGLCDTLWPGRTPPLLLVPALPEAGRITRNGVHLLVRDGSTTPLAETEYAGDGLFAYRSSRLLAWAEERSGGLFAVADGSEFPVEALRAQFGPRALAAVLADLTRVGRPCVCAPDVETDADIALVAQAIGLAPPGIAIRCAPALVGALAGTTAQTLASPPRAARLLIVCGSYVPLTTRQLARLRHALGEGCFVEVDVGALRGQGAASEVRHASSLAGDRLSASGVAVLATAGVRSAETVTLQAGEQIADGLAAAAAAVRPRPDVILAKGGITSAVTLRALGASHATVVGPILPGVSLWKLPGGQAYVVVPGNVGDDDLLVRLVDLIRDDHGR
jgi:uncharacterized protein YgbK (DUF1537 family)